MSKLHIDLTRYAEDKDCYHPDGLKAKLLADLSPAVAMMGLQRNRCLVATYVPPNITAGGVIIPTTSIDEERWQGKVGLLLKVGPVAFDYEEYHTTYQRILDEGESSDRRERWKREQDARKQAQRVLNIPVVGDWVAFRTSETHEIAIAIKDAPGLAMSCRQIYDDSIVTTLSDPRIIY